jgi:hypothetical protein
MMYGFGNCAGIPAISSYQEAKAHFEKVNPIRGREQRIKPLGRNRRYTWYLITESIIANQAENSEYKTYACELYGTRCVEYYPNGDIVLRNGGWQTPTSFAFIGYSIRNIGRMLSVSGKWYFINNHNEHIVFKNELHLVKGEDGDYRAKTELQEFKHSANRKAMNAIRKKYSVFINYGKTMLAMDNKIDALELEMGALGLDNYHCVPYNSYQGKIAKDNRTNIFSLLDKQKESGDLDLLYNLARYVAVSAGRHSYRDNKYRCEPMDFIKQFDEMIKFQFRDAVFHSQPVEIGLPFDDRNKKYFKFD